VFVRTKQATERRREQKLRAVASPEAAINANPAAQRERTSPLLKNGPRTAWCQRVVSHTSTGRSLAVDAHSATVLNYDIPQDTES